MNVIKFQFGSKNRRGKIVKLSEDSFRFDYYDVNEKDSSYEFLSSRGFHGGGPSWAGIIYGLIKLKDEKIFRQIDFDPESDGLAIWSSKRLPLENISTLIDEVKNDPSLMNKAIEIAMADSQME
ncbi:MAG: hypothetical protein JXR76_18665 [Deltaproteobacteria bacterium]|nr:hypothetical protein [Deltaproteobacteria bacterium]